MRLEPFVLSVFSARLPWSFDDWGPLLAALGRLYGAGKPFHLSAFGAPKGGYCERVAWRSRSCPDIVPPDISISVAITHKKENIHWQ